MTPDQQMAQLADEWPSWHIWRGRDSGGRPSGWNATLQAGGTSVILSAGGPEELRRRLRRASAPAAASAGTP